MKRRLPRKTASKGTPCTLPMRDELIPVGINLRVTEARYDREKDGSAYHLYAVVEGTAEAGRKLYVGAYVSSSRTGDARTRGDPIAPMLRRELAATARHHLLDLAVRGHRSEERAEKRARKAK